MIYINDLYDVAFYNKEGKYHRLNGPAFIDGNYEVWFENGIRIK